jgi:DNA-directed RNA polymerase specialized sigma24 family protein
VDDPRRLLGWLIRVARNRLRDHLRRQLAGRRNMDRLGHPGPQGLAEVADPAPAPGAAMADRECLELIVCRMTPQEQDILQRLNEGQTWPEIAAAHGAGAEAIRKRYRRALQMILGDLGLGGGGEGGRPGASM